MAHLAISTNADIVWTYCKTLGQIYSLNQKQTQNEITSNVLQ